MQRQYCEEDTRLEEQQRAEDERLEEAFERDVEEADDGDDSDSSIAATRLEEWRRIQAVRLEERQRTDDKRLQDALRREADHGGIDRESDSDSDSDDDDDDDCAGHGQIQYNSYTFPIPYKPPYIPYKRPIFPEYIIPNIPYYLQSSLHSAPPDCVYASPSPAPCDGHGLTQHGACCQGFPIPRPSFVVGQDKSPGKGCHIEHTMSEQGSL